MLIGFRIIIKLEKVQAGTTVYSQAIDLMTLAEKKIAAIDNTR